MIVYNYNVPLVKVRLKLAEGVELADVAAEALELFREGANPEATQPEAHFAYSNTPLYGRYVTIPCAQHLAVALQYVSDNNLSVLAELIDVMWPGYDDETGEAVVYPDLYYEVPEVDEAGKQIGTRQQLIGEI